MPSPALSDVIALTDAKIDQTVQNFWPGVYVLDDTSSGPFAYAYVGRSDTDLNARLHNWVGKYKFFKAAYSSSAQDAFEAECHLYHDFNPPDNAIHPARPNNSAWKCPRCYVFD